MEIDREYDCNIERMRRDEFPAIKDVTYLDHAGTTLVSKSQLIGHHNDLLTNLYGNPHSRSQSSQLTSDTIDQVRYKVLQLFNTTADKYSVVFTSGCTASLKIIAESFNFLGDACHDNDLDGNGCDLEEAGCHPKRGVFCYLGDNHTSVQGMREIAFIRAGKILCVDLESNGKDVISSHTLYENKLHGKGGNSLFAFPAQSNFSGQKYPLDWVTMTTKGMMGFQDKEDSQRWYTMLDAASFVGTSPLDLGKYSPDFVSISFYKIFGFPTGLGALLVCNAASDTLQKTYFGGGTVNVSLARERFHVPRTAISERFEDGTVSFLDIIALQHGFRVLETLAGGIKQISLHTFSLAKFLHHQLSACRHGNGSPLAEIYCKGDFSDPEMQGAIINFNLKRENGEYIGFAEVDKLAQLHNIDVRTGCFCNVGACQSFLSMSSVDIRRNFDAGHVCGDDRDLIDGKPTGSIRVSFGYMSTFSDVCKFLQFIVDCFLENAPKMTFDHPKLEVKQTKQDLTTSVTNNRVIDNKSTISLDRLRDNYNTEIGSQSEFSRIKIDQSEESQKTASRSNSQSEDSIQHLEVNIRTDNTSDTKPASEQCKLVSNSSRSMASPWQQNGIKHLTDIFLYPVKSCAAFKVDKWPLSKRGLLYDREWMIVTESGIALSQKRETTLCLLQPSIDLSSDTLYLNFPGMPSLCVNISGNQSNSVIGETGLCTSKVCGDRVSSLDCGQEVSDWLSQALKRPGCRLVRQNPDDDRKSKMKKSAEGGEKNTERLSLANESQYLLINRASVVALHEQTLMKQTSQESGEITGVSGEVPDLENLIMRFRANIVVSCGKMFEEEEWGSVQIGQSVFMNQGPCTRCQMVCVDQTTGERSKEPLKTLAVWRGKKIPFGIHLGLQKSKQQMDQVVQELRVGDPILFP